MDGAELREIVAAFRLMPYIARDHWFMKPKERFRDGEHGDNDDFETESGSEPNSQSEQSEQENESESSSDAMYSSS